MASEQVAPNCAVCWVRAGVARERRRPLGGIPHRRRVAGVGVLLPWLRRARVQEL